LKELEQEGANFGNGLHFGHDIDIAGVHKSHIIDFFGIFSHHLHNFSKRQFLLNDIIMLVDHDMIRKRILFHHKPDILRKPAPELSLNNGELLVVLPILFLNSFFENEIIIKCLLSDNT
jgi:hypothetical protein